MPSLPTYNPEQYSHIISVAREKWNYSPVIIQQICRVAEKMKKQGFTESDILESDTDVLIGKYLEHPYRNRDFGDRWRAAAIRRYKACLEII